jgi:hypothetical protein
MSLLYLPNIVVKQLVIQPHILQIPASNLGSEPGCGILSPSSKMLEFYIRLATATSFHILFNSLFTNLPTTEHYI